MSAVYVLDRVTVAAGKLRPYRELLEREYLPGARARGMELVGAFVTPPVELDHAENELVLLWSLRDVAAFWKMRMRASADPGVAAFWRDAQPWTVRRERHYLASADLAGA